MEGLIIQERENSLLINFASQQVIKILTTNKSTKFLFDSLPKKCNFCPFPFLSSFFFLSIWVNTILTLIKHRNIGLFVENGVLLIEKRRTQESLWIFKENSLKFYRGLKILVKIRNFNSFCSLHLHHNTTKKQLTQQKSEIPSVLCAMWKQKHVSQLKNVQSSPSLNIIVDMRLLIFSFYFFSQKFSHFLQRLNIIFLYCRVFNKKLQGEMLNLTILKS